ncbi:hypothetical protein E5Q53_00745 [Haemophilus parahaemolyticus]|uniref:Uncharacterized protein n=2 Tax=Haemophilus parahaemolyticus TaxID=735 RepID=A0AAE6JPP1_HAEPH|nr:hypothetical protein [Haemophilus parahaemolyticus]EIJ71017.1 hypothetical protein HMPREF1050_1056 [Haemophilus parahaemolyticus HK385]OOR97719.1 hypothetical protein B0185_02660 [Haemophilus parahaemolyticus]QEN10102.1 hypothetical protein E5Q53_00745 [Haemophilus parahaemolyticus]QRP13087.1 hypothetical protein I6J29_02730 [Haemophilus parahaemolyticus]STO66057.1 Uncharacterised protein [Haemophilus parahaemolyticus HK385]
MQMPSNEVILWILLVGSVIFNIALTYDSKQLFKKIKAEEARSKAYKEEADLSWREFRKRTSVLQQIKALVKDQ